MFTTVTTHFNLLGKNNSEIIVFCSTSVSPYFFEIFPRFSLVGSLLLSICSHPVASHFFKLP